MAYVSLYNKHANADAVCFTTIGGLEESAGLYLSSVKMHLSKSVT